MEKKRQGNKRANNKKRNIIIASCCALLAIVLVVVLVVVLNKDDDTKPTKETVEGNSLENWDDRIADLENEPISDMDVVYKDVAESDVKPYLIQINKSQNCITIYKRDENGKYTKPYKSMICSVGYDTPVGEFETSDKYQWKIVNGNVWAQYATRVVGNVLLHSMPYAANSKDTLIARYYNQLGSTFSSSCVRMSARDSEWIMKNCPAGTKVQIYESDNEEPLERPKSMIIPEDAVWDPTDSDPANPYHGVQLGFEGIESHKLVERGTQINYLDGVTIKDTCGNDLSSQVKVTTNLDAFTLGTYEVSYSVEDAAGKTAQATAVYEVVDTAPPQFSGLKSILNFSSIAEVTQENILKGVYVIDNNELLDNSRITVTIPTVMEGNNAITLAVTDNYDNTTTTVVTAAVHVKPPVISLKPGVETILPLTQKVDQKFALSRVTATDDGEAMAADKISVSITPTKWGYSFKYTATDENGYQGILYDSVTYVEYSIHLPEKVSVTDLTDREQLLKDVELRNNLGGSLELSEVDVSVKFVSDMMYQVTYEYAYSSPLGEKVASAKALIIYNDTEQEGEATQLPPSSEAPDIPDGSEEPLGMETPSDNEIVE